MKELNFLYEIDQRVITPFGEDGIVSMLAYDDGGKQYYVKTKDASNWFKEGQLQAK
ncbi:MAG: hypothetical protein WC750_06290 [Patescibacteria group bacterium]|jgi:hypothetical protein